MRKLFATALVAVAVLAVPATASAAKVCKDVYKDGKEVTLTAWGSTSCPFALETYRAARRKAVPRRLRVYSPVTHRWYRMRRTSFEWTSDYLSFVYQGHGSGRSTLNVQAQIRG